MTRFVVTGTDTGIGKTIFSAALACALGLPYWKPIQSGLEEETDSEVVARLARVTIHPETWRLVPPHSPPFAPEVVGVYIYPCALYSRTSRHGGDQVCRKGYAVSVPYSV